VAPRAPRSGSWRPGPGRRSPPGRRAHSPQTPHTHTHTHTHLGGWCHSPHGQSEISNLGLMMVGRRGIR
jgi:hypothetical protein